MADGVVVAAFSDSAIAVEFQVQVHVMTEFVGA